MSSEHQAEAGHSAPRKTRWLRIVLILLLAGIGGLALSYSSIVRTLGGAWEEAGPNWLAQLSPEARALVERSTTSLDPARLMDVHTHVAGIGTEGSGCEVHPHMRSWMTPLAHVRFDLYLSASGVTDLEQADAQFFERLQSLVASLPRAGRFCVLAFDHAYLEDGTLDRAGSEFYVPNEYVWARCLNNDSFVPCISVHPYRKDALAELERWAVRGVRMVKWLPNAMGIDPASPLCDAFYAKLVEHDMTLLTHTGKELAVHAEEAQAFGNPLRLRRALDRGVRVIAAHCASLGDDLDIDEPEGARTHKPSFDLFLRLMDEKRYEGLLFGEISALVQFNRLGPPLMTLLERRDLHARLVNGSDYPLPAVNALIRLKPLVELGLITAVEADLLLEIYRAHPLAFDLALKRSLRSPTTGLGFDDETFLVPAAFGF